MARRSAERPQSWYEREDAIKEYRQALRELQGTSDRLDYELELQGLPKARSSAYSFAGMSTEEIKQHTEDFKRMRGEEIREELDRTRGERTGAGAKDNITALMEATDKADRDALRDLIEENYEMMETAADILENLGEDALSQWINSYGDDEVLSELWDDDDFEDIF